MSLIKSMVSSKSNEWSTPNNLFDCLDGIFHFTLDPCSTHENAKCKKHYTIEDDGLSKSWKSEVVFMNPPYGGKTKDWLLKAKEESQRNKAIVICLLVSSTDRSYWHEIISKYANEIWFLRGRIRFGKSKSTAPFASAIVVFKPTYLKDVLDTDKLIIKWVNLKELII
jgi:site-specific DNA-methyltransferase (adenine-specific)